MYACCFPVVASLLRRGEETRKEERGERTPKRAAVPCGALVRRCSVIVSLVCAHTDLLDLQPQRLRK
jgi:hypothetical protein